jgi:hypothetical protein
MTGLAVQRVGDDGPGDGYGGVPVWRGDRDHADDQSARCALITLADLRHAA